MLFKATDPWDNRQLIHRSRGVRFAIFSRRLWPLTQLWPCRSAALEPTTAPLPPRRVAGIDREAFW